MKKLPRLWHCVYKNVQCYKISIMMGAVLFTSHNTGHFYIHNAITEVVFSRLKQFTNVPAVSVDCLLYRPSQAMNKKKCF